MGGFVSSFPSLLCAEGLSQLEAGSARPRHRLCRSTARAAAQSRAETLSSGQCGAWPQAALRRLRLPR